MTLEGSEVLGEDPSAKQGTSRRVEGRVLAPVEVWTASSAGGAPAIAGLPDARRFEDRYPAASPVRYSVPVR